MLLVSTSQLQIAEEAVTIYNDYHSILFVFVFVLFFAVDLSDTFYKIF